MQLNGLVLLGKDKIRGKTSMSNQYRVPFDLVSFLQLATSNPLVNILNSFSKIYPRLTHSSKAMLPLPNQRCYHLSPGPHIAS